MAGSRSDGEVFKLWSLAVDGEVEDITSSPTIVMGKNVEERTETFQDIDFNPDNPGDWPRDIKETEVKFWLSSSLSVKEKRRLERKGWDFTFINTETWFSLLSDLERGFDEVGVPSGLNPEVIGGDE